MSNAPIIAESIRNVVAKFNLNKNEPFLYGGSRGQFMS
jgi:hypothetical protein